VVIAIVLFIVAFLIYRSNLPEIEIEKPETGGVRFVW
jgi:hypothetical protein